MRSREDIPHFGYTRCDHPNRKAIKGVLMASSDLERLLTAPAQTRSVYTKGGFEGLAPRAIQALLAVQIIGEPSVREVALKIAVSQRSAGDLLRKLQSLGLVETRSDPADGRVQRQRITADGRSMTGRFAARVGKTTSEDVPHVGRVNEAVDPRPLSLKDRFASLEGSSSQARGFELERLVAAVLRRASFRVDVNPGLASPNRTDLLASCGPTDYVIEVKATSKPAGLPALNQLVVRLRLAPPGAVGVLVSLSGFARNLPGKVRNDRSLSVLLLGREELEFLVERPWAARTLLQRKLDRLRRDGAVAGAEVLESLSVGGPGLLDSDSTWLVDAEGEVPSWVTGAGEFGLFSFAGSYEALDADRRWADRQRFELDLDVRSQKEMLAKLGELERLGWLSCDGRWCIQQSSLNWHGVGANSLKEALRGWKQRYDELQDPHYREEVVYSDANHLGAYVLVFDVAARPAREVWYARMCVQIQGIPLDPQPYQELARTMSGETEAIFFTNPGHQEGTWNPSGSTLRKLKPAARIVTKGSLPNHDELYVRGVVLTNPFHGKDWRTLPEGCPRQLVKSALLVCQLGDWHRLADGPATYQITDIEWASMSSGFVISVGADWDDNSFERRLHRRYSSGPIRPIGAADHPIELDLS
jgi:DNA-binding MarR family transcriptional regulator